MTRPMHRKHYRVDNDTDLNNLIKDLKKRGYEWFSPTLANQPINMPSVVHVDPNTMTITTSDIPLLSQEDIDYDIVKYTSGDNLDLPDGR